MVHTSPSMVGILIISIDTVNQLIIHEGLLTKYRMTAMTAIMMMIAMMGKTTAYQGKGGGGASSGLTTPAGIARI